MIATIRAGGQGLERAFITASIMAAALMQTLDTTIANVALPHMQGGVSASQDQIVWVLTSYIVAAAVMTPLTGYLSDKIGRKNLFLFSVAGFTIASAMCGAAQSLGQIVAFRFVQGLAGAALMPLAQAVMLDINPPERYGQAMATFASAVVLGPLIGPTLGGWLTENYSWRWVFFINLPVGAAAFLGAWTFLPGKPHPNAPRFDAFGFGSLAGGICALQLMLDRGQQNDWFGSTETWIEAGVAGLGFYLFLIHTLTARAPLFSRGVFADRNFRTTTLASLVIMGAMYASLALVPPMLQNLYGYPVFTTGLLLVPRGLGVFLTMLTVGRLLNVVDARMLIGLGLALLATSFVIMSRFALSMGFGPMIWSGFIQGIAMGLLFVPLNTIGFMTLPGQYRIQATTISNLVRNLGGSLGISLLQALFTANAQRAHAALASHVRPEAPGLARMLSATGLPMESALPMINGLATRDSMMIAYVNDYWLMAVVMVLLFPVLLLLRPAQGQPGGGAATRAQAME